MKSHDTYININRVRYLKYLKCNADKSGFNCYCNICGYRLFQFDTFNNRKNALCPVCGSLERHRHLALYLQPLYPFLSGKKLLHFAPEGIIKNMLSASAVEYYDADIVQGRASYQIDITAISFESNFFDFVLAIHVLEHIVDDTLAMRNIFRVLKPGATAILSVPLFEALCEEPADTPEERVRLYGQNDHVRKYDFATFFERLEHAGFTVTAAKPASFPELYQKECRIGDVIFFAKKPD